MKHIVFEYRDEWSKGKWNKQECYCESIQDCIRFYGLDDCEFRIISADEEKS